MKVLMLNGSWNNDGSTKAGLQEMAKTFAANLARNMVYVMKCQKAGRDVGILPPANESGALTNFVR